MRKKGILMLGLAAFLTLGTGFTSMAAAGWAMENGQWVYYDNAGEQVTNEWKRGADNQWRYLNSYGQMAVDRWVDETYYVDSNGIMVAGKWMKLNSNYSGLTSEDHWYYFQDSGKAVTSSWKKIKDRWYHFDSYGTMETGWLDDNMSYAKEDGAAVTGWQKLYPPDGDGEDRNPFEDDERRWYYFNNSGKKFVPELKNDAQCGEKRIDGTYYCFNSRGAMQTGWAYVGGTNAEDGTINGYRFYGNNGKAVSGWYSAAPPSELSGYENDVEWFYFSNSGVPKSGPVKGTASTADFLRVNGKTYLFNELGVPVTGLQKVYTGKSASGEYTSYYFDPNSCAVMSGKITVEENDGNRCQYYFASSGKGFTGVQSGSLYYMGKLQTADNGMKYDVITIPGTNGKATNYVVNASGKVMRSSSALKDSDGTKYTTNNNGVLTKINGESVPDGSTFSQPREPDWN
ncbi:MAG: cell wall-binding protein [Hungatella sp.]|nr:cell wall-binding protein [Hungatella sp.]